MQLKNNSLLQGGRYKIIDILGQGGFGITYLAIQSGLERKVAIKEFFMKELCERNESTKLVTLGTEGSRETVARYREKFLKEARYIASLNHPNIVRIIDVFEENGTAYYVMEYIEGESLSEMVKRGGALPETVAVNYIRQVAHALSYIHAKSINHLDIKPANIMVRKSDSTAVLIDFGLSKQYDSTGGQTSSTPVGISEGYAPLEQYQMGGVNTFSPQTDIYSLGATLFYLVTGMVPPSSSEVLNNGIPALPSHISVSTRTAINQAMQFRKNDRPQTVMAFLTLFQETTIKTQINDVNSHTNDDDETTRVIGTPKVSLEISEKGKQDNNHNFGEDNGENTFGNEASSKRKALSISMAIALIIIMLIGVFVWNMKSDSGVELIDDFIPDSVLVDTEEVAAEEQFSVKSLSRQSSTYRKDNLESGYKVEVDFPESGNPILQKNIMEWIAETLNYTGNLDNKQGLIDSYYQRIIKKEMTGYDKIKMVYETPKLVTFEHDGYLYEGGAHGGSYRVGATFRKEDGRLVTWQMFTQNSDLRTKIKEGLKSYFEVQTDDDLACNLVLDGEPVLSLQALSFLPFPDSNPWIVSDGIVFHYKEYEITAHSWGAPFCILTTNSIRNNLSKALREMLN